MLRQTPSIAFESNACPVFSPEWFERHQHLLLWLLSAPLIGRWFRRVLAIRPHDVGYHGCIIQLPNLDIQSTHLLQLKTLL